MHTGSPGERDEGMKPLLLSQEILGIVGAQRPTQIP